MKKGEYKYLYAVPLLLLVPSDGSEPKSGLDLPPFLEGLGSTF